MADNKNVFPDQEPVVEIIDEAEEEMALDDARRVKSLSPGMLVFKRFIRNKLAVVGLAILIFMFTFAFLGPLFMPYEQDQYFTYTGTQSKDYAGAIYNTELRYTIAEDQSLTGNQKAKFLLALGKGESTFTVDDDTHYIDSIAEDTQRIIDLNPVAEELLGRVNPVSSATLPEGLVEAFEAAKEAESDSFVLNGELYRITQDRKTKVISTEVDVALASLNIFDAYRQGDLPVIDSFAFQFPAQRAIANRDYTFTADDQPYAVEYDEGQITIYDQNGQPFAGVSQIIVNPLDQNEFLSFEYKSTIRQAIRNNQDRTDFTHSDGQTIEYRIARVNQNYYIRRQTPTELISLYELPSAEHPLGLDNNGMDNLTRLMYGGRISLMVGFVVVILEMIIGVIIGGISGYFGGGVDTALMRFVDLFNSIPFYPVVIIFGSVMDTLDVEPITRIFLLMAVLGVLGWTGIARVVRGQILSLREQDFMVATEATGIRTSRRIFRHLVPNVMPLLIVSATASLGGIIISEATLGFLGLGVRYPLASWGSIINVASDPYVMTNFWFMWIPAGSLILLTVLGFNFVGDGLRDAFDPKMKR
jgi:peptide/nickel transport system permease protein